VRSVTKRAGSIDNILIKARYVEMKHQLAGKPSFSHVLNFPTLVQDLNMKKHERQTTFSLNQTDSTLAGDLAVRLKCFDIRTRQHGSNAYTRDPRNTI